MGDFFTVRDSNTGIGLLFRFVLLEIVGGVQANCTVSVTRLFVCFLCSCSCVINSAAEPACTEYAAASENKRDAETNGD